MTALAGECPVSGRDKGIAKGVIQRHMPTACVMCKGPIGDAPCLLQLGWTEFGMSVTGICATCGAQVSARTAMNTATAGGEDRGLDVMLGQVREAVGVDPNMADEGSR